MQCRPGELQFFQQLCGIPLLDKIEIKLFIKAIEFIANNRVAGIFQVYPDLVKPSRNRQSLHQGIAAKNTELLKNNSVYANLYNSQIQLENYTKGV